jgi:translation initiation factor IF-1
MGSIGKMKKNMGNIGNKMGKSNIWINDDHEDP